MVRFIFATLFFICFFLAGATNAQNLTENDFSLEVEPLFPKPGEVVTATIQSYAIDVNELPITWTYGGKIIAKEIGKKSVVVLAGESGVNKILEVSINVGISIIKKSLVIKPSNLTLLWEGIDSYTPPFYKGKAEIPIEGIVRVAAFPDNGVFARNYSYLWTKNDSNSEQGSGYGKISYIYRGSYLDDSDKVGSSLKQGGDVVNNNSVVLNFVKPTIEFYKKENGFIDYSKNLGSSYYFNNSVETFVAEPFNFSVSNLIDSDLDIKWKIGEREGSSGDRSNEIALSPNSSGGSAILSVLIKNLNYIFQFTEKSTNINF